MPTKPTDAPCAVCKGTGRVPLSKELIQTIDIVAAAPGISSPEVHRMLKTDLHRTAINHRLEHLVDLGKLKREQRGKVWFYSI